VSEKRKPSSKFTPEVQAMINERIRQRRESKAKQRLRETIERDRALRLTPAKQLQSLLPRAVDTKDEFFLELAKFRNSRLELNSLYEQNAAILRAQKAMQEKLTNDDIVRKRHQTLVGKMLNKVFRRKTYEYFQLWRESADQMRGLRSMMQRYLRGQKFGVFAAWKQHYKNRKIGKLCGAICIQCQIRRVAARRMLKRKKLEHESASKINRSVRACLARHTLKLAKRHKARNAEKAAVYLKRMMHAHKFKVFIAWKKRVAVMKHVATMLGRCSHRTKSVYFVKWARFRIKSKKTRRADALKLLQRVGRGYNARCRAHRKRVRKLAATRIQKLFRIFRARRLVKRKMRAVRIAKRRCAQAFVSKQRNIMLLWSKYTKLMKHTRALFDRCSFERLRTLFDRWKMRKLYVTIIQKVFRGWTCRCILKREKMARLAEEFKNSLLNANSDELGIDVSGYDSPLLRDLLSKLELINGFDEKKRNFVDLSLHGDGSMQRFELPKHKTFLVSVINKAIKAEVLRINREREDAETESQRAAQEWRRTLEEFLGKSSRPPIFKLEMDRYSVYGKSFDVKIRSVGDALEILRVWKDLCASGMITTSVLICWITEVMLLKKGTPPKTRKQCWRAVCESLPRETLQALSEHIMACVQGTL